VLSIHIFLVQTDGSKDNSMKRNARCWQEFNSLLACTEARKWVIIILFIHPMLLQYICVHIFFIQRMLIRLFEP